MAVKKTVVEEVIMVEEDKVNNTKVVNSNNLVDNTKVVYVTMVVNNIKVVDATHRSGADFHGG